MAWMPGAIHKPIAKHNKRPAAAHNRLNLHIAVSEAASLYGFFGGALVCSHLYVRRDGTIEQYISTEYCSGADLEGNDATISVETQGGVTNANGEPWTEAQVAALARIVVWVNSVHPEIPIQLATDSKPGASSKGVSWHRLGIDPWRVAGGMQYSKSRGKICPGNARIAQIPGIVSLAKGTPVPVSHPVVVVPAAPVPAPPAPAKAWLQEGDSGAAVADLQRKLTAAGYPLDADGKFGPLTEKAVRAYQTSRGLIVDGLAGAATIGALNSGAPAIHVPAANVLQRGSHGAEVERLQRTLRDGYPLYAKKLHVDGSFGPATEAVVKEFQRRAGLVPDGVVGPRTRAALGL